MGNIKTSALLSLIGSLFMLFWPHVLPKSVSTRMQTADSTSLSAGQGGQHPHVVKRSTQSCDSTYDHYCLNKGQCMFLVDINEHHCNCEKGFHGFRCASPELVIQPMGKEQLIVTVFCVSLLIIGLTGALYFCFKWYKKNRGSQRSPDCLERLTHKRPSTSLSTEMAKQDITHFSK
ncbi:proepiregulin-like [Platichthys flesus]|uniref:proepiregulin-like n=1 Tax=Platichthys flesus TaxID=8260 RepID=UPI001A8AE049|nr:proepiregulin-like [Platichthys flesus]